MRRQDRACELPQTRAADGELRGRMWLIGSFLLCPCHLPVTLSVLSVIAGGTALGVVVRDHSWLVATVVSSAWLMGTARGLWLVHQADGAAKAALRLARAR